MVKHFWKKLFAVVSVGLLVGCAGMQSEPEMAEMDFTPQQISGTCYEQKSDNFLVLLDASGSMGETYEGQTKFKTAQEVVSRMNQTIPGDMDLNAAVRTFGAGFSDETRNIVSPGPFSKDDLASALGDVSYGGYTPIGPAVAAGGDDKGALTGTTAVILVSDGKQNVGENATKAARMVKDRFGDNICFYTVLVGDDPAGKELMEEIANIGDCGFATTADAVYSSEGMADFVSSAFCSGAPPPVVATVGDADGDGVPDDRDKCPNTPRGATVNEDGCWAYQGEIFFDFDKAVVKPEAYYILDEAAAVLAGNPGLEVEIQGHTDSIGTEEYNLGLSQRRAEAVEKYLEDNGVNPDQISARGLGEAYPVASNDTKEGRAKNRRVEFRAAQ
jgi:OOP family OmpA-OmpF porin